MIPRLGLFGVLALWPALGQVSGTPPAPDHAVRPAPRSFGPIRDKSEHGDGTATSTNWSGYAVLGSDFTSASGSWVVPAANCTGVTGDQYAAFWVGLDGYSSNTVEQTGTDSDCVGGKANYYAWFEFYPHPSYEILGLTVAPGNLISASVTYSGKEFTVTITNTSTGQSYTTSDKVNAAQRSSAEWITEAPCCTRGGGILPLSDFDGVNFGSFFTNIAGTDYATDSTTSGSIGSFPAASVEEINKVGSSSSPQTSTCNSLIDTPVPNGTSIPGTSFSCTWAP